MEPPAGYTTVSSSLNRVTGSLPKDQLDQTGRSLYLQTGQQWADTGKVSSPDAAEGSPLPDSSPEASPTDGAGALSASSPQEPQKQAVFDKKGQCIDLLMAGCVQSFVDFLKIAHKEDANEASADDEQPNIHPDDAKHLQAKQTTDMAYLKETLEKAETARRLRNYNTCVEQYNALAEYFASFNLQSSKYFYIRCIDVAAEVGSNEILAKANLNLGICEEKLENWQFAMAHHETALELSTNCNSLPVQLKSASQLCNVYRVLAEELLAESDSGKNADTAGSGDRNDDSGASTQAAMAAADLYEKCVACSKLSREAKLEGLSCHRLGKVKTRLGEHNEAIRLQQQYLDICKQHEDRAGESAARAALALAYEKTGNNDEAKKQLETLLVVAADAGETKAQADACLNLGLLYSEQKDGYDKSIRLLERHFSLARELGDRELVDSARIILGMAKGHGKLDSYMHVVSHDLRSLLEWKSTRVAAGALR